MKNLLRNILLLFLSLVLVNCDEDEVTRRDYPRLNTLPVSEITSEGAKFNAEIIFRGNFEVINYGFVWAENENPTLENSDRVIYSENIQSDKFSEIIETTLKEEISYFVRAFVETNDFIVYGENTSFLSLGSKAPTIQSLFPNVGKVRDTISVIGENFSYLNEKNSIFFNDLPSKIVTSSDTLIKVIIPDQLLVKSSLVSASVLGNIASQKLEFSLLPPNIVSFEPKSASTRETIKIYGENFGTSIDANQVLFNDVEATIINASEVELEVEVPSGIPINSFLKVIAYEQESTSYQTFEILTPELNELIPNKATVNKEITLTGNNFSPFEEDNEVLFDGIPANILSSSKTTLQVEVPSGISKRSIEVTMSTGGHDTSPISFEYVGGNWVQGSTFPDVHRLAPAFFQIGDEFYVGLGKNNITMKNDFWKYNASTNTWTQLNDFPGQSRIFSSSFVINNKGYIGLGATTAAETVFLNDFWEYDPILDSWTQVADFPGEARLRATSFVDSNLGIVGMGHSREAPSGTWIPTNYKDFYSYDPNANSWTSMPDFPGQERYSPSQFVIGSKVYLGLGATGSYFSSSADLLTDFWEYDLGSNIWSRLSDIPFNSRLFTASFTSYNRGYIALGVNYSGSQIGRQNSIYEYNPLVDDWTESKFNPYGSGDFPIYFEHSNKTYLLFIERTNKTPTRTFEIFEPYE